MLRIKAAVKNLVEKARGKDSRLMLDFSRTYNLAHKLKSSDRKKLIILSSPFAKNYRKRIRKLSETEQNWAEQLLVWKTYGQFNLLRWMVKQKELPSREFQKISATLLEKIIQHDSAAEGTDALCLLIRYSPNPAKSMKKLMKKYPPGRKQKMSRLVENAYDKMKRSNFL